MSSRKLILYIILLLVLSATAYTMLVIVPTQLAQRSYEGAKQIGKDFRDAFGFTPEISVNNTIVLQQQIPILEVATIAQKFQHQYRWTNTWLRSKKEITITGTLEAKGGFNLNERFAISIEGRKANVLLPAPQLLSLEPLGDYTFEDEDGLWNWVDNNDRAAAVSAFQQDARKFSAQAAFINDARITMEQKIREILKIYVDDVEFSYTEVSPRVRRE